METMRRKNLLKDPPEKIIVYGAFTFVRQPPPPDPNAEKKRSYEKMDQQDAKPQSHEHEKVDESCQNTGCGGLFDKKKCDIYDYMGFQKDYETFMDNMQALDEDRIIQRYIMTNYSSSTCKMSKDQFLDALKGTIL